MSETALGRRKNVNSGSSLPHLSLTPLNQSEKVKFSKIFLLCHNFFYVFPLTFPRIQIAQIGYKIISFVLMKGHSFVLMKGHSNSIQKRDMNNIKITIDQRPKTSKKIQKSTEKSMNELFSFVLCVCFFALS
ncbi:hypothetical protein MTR67_031803 [Solanum verrucosum]|uniref:Uncharacterized protein n=1 Tax=Solanum verrucosum TaxID=315347 RepID=A0AAF0ZGU7_SOLVR|nr:hypothetical protein MTR67_031803 [Solanum verrucosum]